MRSIVSLLVALAAASAAPLVEKEDVYAKGIEQLKEVLGEGLLGINVTAAKVIVADEAASLGITTEQHWATCVDGMPKTHTRLVNFVKEHVVKHYGAPESIEDIEAKAFGPAMDDDDSDAIEDEFEKNGHLLALKNRDDVFPALKKHLPKAHDALVKIVGEDFKDYDEEMEAIGDKDAIQFMKNIKDAALDLFVQWAQARSDEDKLIKLYTVAGKALSKRLTDWDNLSRVTKIAMEKKTCLQTTFRLFDELAANKGQITRIKEQVNATIAMAELMEKLNKKAENSKEQ